MGQPTAVQAAAAGKGFISSPGAAEEARNVHSLTAEPQNGKLGPILSFQNDPVCSAEEAKTPVGADPGPHAQTCPARCISGNHVCVCPAE